MGLGFQAVAGAKNIKFEPLPQATARITEHVQEQGLSPDQIPRQARRVEGLMRKPFNFGAYARISAQKPNTDISNITMKGKGKSSKGSKRRATRKGDLNWETITAVSALIQLEEYMKQMRPTDSTLIYYKGNPQLQRFEESLDALQVFSHYVKDRQVASTHAGRLEWERALDVLASWDMRPNSYVYEADRVFIEDFMNTFEVDAQWFQELLSAHTPLGSLDMVSRLSGHLSQALPRTNHLTISQIYKAMQDLMANSATLAVEDKEELRATWRLLIAELMAGGAIPTREKVLEALGFPNQRLQRINLELFFGTKELSVLEKKFDQFIVETQKIKGKEKIEEALGHLRAEGHEPTLERVAQRLSENFLYFQAWHDQHSGESQAEALQQWIDEYNIGSTRDLGIVEQGLAPSPMESEDIGTRRLKIEDHLRQAVAEVKRDGTGLVPDIFNVAEKLYFFDSGFRQWVDRREMAGSVNGINVAQYQWLKPHDAIIIDDQIRQKVACGQGLLAWISQRYEPVLAYSEIFKKFGIFVPTQEELDWNVRYQQGLNDMDPLNSPGIDYTNSQEPDPQFTMLVWFYETFTNDQIMGLRLKNKIIEASEEQVQKDREFVAKVRFLRDTMGAAYRSETEGKRFVSLLMKYTSVDPESIPEAVKDQLMSLHHQNEGESQTVLQKSHWTLHYMFMDFLYASLQNKGPDPFTLRDKQHRRFARVVMLLAFSRSVRADIVEAARAPKKETRSQWLERNRRSDFYYSRIYPLLEEHTLAHLVEALNNWGDPVSLEEFRQWGQQDHRADFLRYWYGFQDLQEADFEGWQHISWDEMEGKIREAAQRMNSMGIMPDVYNVSDYLYTHFPRFWRWVEEQAKIKVPALREEKVKQKLSDWLRVFKPDMNREEFFGAYGVWAPGIQWDDIGGVRYALAYIGSGRTERIQERDIDFREFEGRWAAWSWFVNLLSEEELSRLLKVERMDGGKVVPFKFLEAGLRYDWYVQNKPSLKAEWVLDLWQYTNTELKISALPPSFKKRVRIPPSTGETTIPALFLYQLTHRENQASMFGWRLAQNHHRRLLSVLSTLVYMHIKAIEMDKYVTQSFTNEIVTLEGRTLDRPSRRRLEKLIQEREKIRQSGFLGILLEHVSLEPQLTMDEVQRFIHWTGFPVEGDLNGLLESEKMRGTYGFSKASWGIVDGAMAGKRVPGGIDFNARNLAMIIKRDGHGMPLPIFKQDLAQLSNFDGLDPVIEFIRPASQVRLVTRLFLPS
ncbi:MAG: hypothetical protein HQL13_02130 [Candidatus Omnitrophica bacterium]|nr:hypothetical protein [Candidatus Omnitrophota bacterium]